MGLGFRLYLAALTHLLLRHVAHSGVYFGEGLHPHWI